MKRLLTLFTLLFSLSATAQDPPVAFTYVHIDKNIYIPGETVWFKAYFPSTTNKLNETLLVRLADSRENTIIAREFPAYDLRAHGQLVLPDSIPAGHYTFIAYGNNTGADAGDVFTQSITVIDNTDGAPTASLQVDEAATLARGNKVTLRFSLKHNGRPVTDARGKCILTVQGSDKALVTEKFKTDANGSATATFTYPEISPYEHLSLQGAFTVDDSPAPFSLVLPSQKKAITVTATPEGGVAIVGSSNTITVQATNDSSQPVSGVSVTLAEDNTPVITAVTDAQGLAVIQHTFQDKAYSITAALAAENFKTEIPLEVQKRGLSLTLEGGSRLIIRNAGPGQKTRLELWSQGEVFFAKDITVTANGSVPVTLPASAENRIISAALFNPQGQLTNERIFYTGTREGYIVTADFGSKKFTTRQNVTATLTVTDARGNPVQANLSAVVVHRAILEKGRYKTITASRYSTITKVNALQQILGFDNATINNYLGNKKWRANLHLPVAKALNTMPGITGMVSRKNKKPMEMKQMTLMAPAGPQLIKINENGSFYIKPEYLLGYEGEKCYLFFGNDELNDYTVSITPNAIPETTAEPEAHAYAMKTQTAALPGIPGVIQVEEVVIEKKTDRISSAEYQRWVRDYTPGCPDWICYSGEINCTMHNVEDRSKKPILGQKYYYKGKPILYTECINAPAKLKRTIELKTITIPHDFPVPELEDELDLKFYTTLAWLPNIDTDANGRATVQFTTADLQGNFIMVLQGLNTANNDAIYGEAVLQVGDGK